MIRKAVNHYFIKSIQLRASVWLTLLNYWPALLALSWLIWANFTGHFSVPFISSASYSLLGICGAIFANLSGAGGGVVFIPVFSYLGISDSQALSTSFVIQCFGMTAGAITWGLHYYKGFRQSTQWQDFAPIIIITALTSIAGLWTVYGGVVSAPSSLQHLFSIFSIVLGLSLLVQVFLLKPSAFTRQQLDKVDYAALVVVGYFGGLITAWLSVGVGELLVLYLILRRFDITMSVAAAVVVTAITVWSAAVEHLWLSHQTVWEVAMFAGPGAVIGGIMAKTIAAMISARMLKIVLAVWILIMGLVG
jgi:uncharacterized membrane protein YfcA